MFQVMYHTCTQPTPPGPGSLAPRPAAAASATRLHAAGVVMIIVGPCRQPGAGPVAQDSELTVTQWPGHCARP